jgi:hypothetical protein
VVEEVGADAITMGHAIAEVPYYAQHLKLFWNNKVEQHMAHPGLIAVCFIK